MIKRFALAYGLLYVSAVVVGVGVAVWFLFEHGANAEIEMRKLYCSNLGVLCETDIRVH